MEYFSLIDDSKKKESEVGIYKKKDLRKKERKQNFNQDKSKIQEIKNEKKNAFVQEKKEKRENTLSTKKKKVRFKNKRKKTFYLPQGNMVKQVAVCCRYRAEKKFGI